MVEHLKAAHKRAVSLRYFTFLWKGLDKFSQDQDADQTIKVYLTEHQCTSVCMQYVWIMSAIPHVTRQVFDVIDVIGLDPLFHQHQISRQRINSTPSE